MNLTVDWLDSALPVNGINHKRLKCVYWRVVPVAAAYARSAIQKMYDMIKLATAELVQFDSLPLPKDS